MVIIGHDRIMASLVTQHYITKIIHKNGKFSINIVAEEMLPRADYAGSVSGAKEDKSGLFKYELGEADTPVIKNAPITIECKVEDVYKTPGFDSFINMIENVYVEDRYLNHEGRIDYSVLKPILFEFPTYEYLKTGEVLGKCLTFKSRGN